MRWKKDKSSKEGQEQNIDTFKQYCSFADSAFHPLRIVLMAPGAPTPPWWTAVLPRQASIIFFLALVFPPSHHLPVGHIVTRPLNLSPPAASMNEVSSLWWGRTIAACERHDEQRYYTRVSETSIPTINRDRALHTLRASAPQTLPMSHPPLPRYSRLVHARGILACLIKASCNENLFWDAALRLSDPCTLPQPRGLRRRQPLPDGEGSSHPPMIRRPCNFSSYVVWLIKSVALSAEQCPSCAA